VRSLLRRLGLLVAAGATAAGLTVALGPAAHASAPACPRGQQVHYGEVSGTLVKRRQRYDDRPAYSVTYRWCTARGRVVGFVVGRVHEDPDVKLDIKPDHPLVWGRTYPVTVQVSGSETKGDTWRITLYGNGRQAKVGPRRT
jgi:hypothetical protein